MRINRLILASSAAFFASASAAFANKPTEGGWWLQEAATPVMEELTKLHNFVFWIITVITVFVTVLMLYIMVRFREKANPVPSKTSHNTLIEVIWTIGPIIVLLAMVVPSMKLLYMQDRLPETEMTIKVTGNTWNWEYAYPDHPNVESYISNPLEKEDAGDLYLLKTDAPLVVPVDTKIKVLVTSSNNLHAFAMPAFGVKIDAVPGRINETWFEVLPGKEGTYFGQCSELCGVNHYKMPIEIKVVSKAEFNNWVANDGAFTKSVALNGGVTAAQE